MREWTRPFRTEAERQQRREERSLYLIPTYDDPAAALALIQRHFGAIFEAELGLWCHERDLWPSPRDFALFERWFALELFPLVDDLGEEPLQVYRHSEAFTDRLRALLG